MRKHFPKDILGESRAFKSGEKKRQPPWLVRFKQTCFVSTRLDITWSPVSDFARCLFLLAVCFSSLSVFCRLRALRPVSSVYRLTWFMTGVFFFSSQKTSQNFSFTELVCFNIIISLTFDIQWSVLEVWKVLLSTRGCSKREKLPALSSSGNNQDAPLS